MGAAFRFDPVGHRYTLDGAELPSVTEIIEPIRPDYSMVSADVLEIKRSLGVAVHLACELDDEGELVEDETDPVVMAYVHGWRRFLRDTGARVEENERQLYHPTLHYAGTLDRFAVVKREGWLLDLKIVRPHPAPAYGVQTAGYDLLRQANGGRPADRRGTVHLLDDGSYRMKLYDDPNDHYVFRALLSVHHWKKENSK